MNKTSPVEARKKRLASGGNAFSKIRDESLVENSLDSHVFRNSLLTIDCAREGFSFNLNQ